MFFQHDHSMVINVEIRIPHLKDYLFSRGSPERGREGKKGSVYALNIISTFRTNWKDRAQNIASGTVALPTEDFL